MWCLAGVSQEYRKLGSTGRCLEGVSVKVFAGGQEVNDGEVRLWHLSDNVIEMEIEIKDYYTVIVFRSP